MMQLLSHYWNLQKPAAKCLLLDTQASIPFPAIAHLDHPCEKSTFICRLPAMIVGVSGENEWMDTNSLCISICSLCLK